MNVLGKLFLAECPSAVTRNHTLDSAFESYVKEEFSALVGAVKHTVALAWLVLEHIFALDINRSLFLACDKAFRRVLATHGVTFTLEVPEAQVAADFAARSGYVEQGIVHKGARAVVKYELVTPSLVVILGERLVRHKVVYGEGSVVTLRSCNFCGVCCRRNSKQGANPQNNIFYL